MEPDPIRVANTRQWLSLATEDLSNAGHDLEASPPFLRSALFHCQQSAEKALKAFLTWHDVPFRKVHELEELGAQCRQVDFTLAPFVENAEPLTKYASRFRYPGAPYELSLEEGKTALARAGEALNAVLDRLPSQVRP
jgi:HEPN domain-containing protein